MKVHTTPEEAARQEMTILGLHHRVLTLCQLPLLALAVVDIMVGQFAVVQAAVLPGLTVFQ
jgi:hypothetical protein